MAERIDLQGSYDNAAQLAGRMIGGASWNDLTEHGTLVSCAAAEVLLQWYEKDYEFDEYDRDLLVCVLERHIFNMGGK